MIKLFATKLYLYISCISLLFCFIPPAISNASLVMWTENTENDVEGYNIYYGTSSGDYTVVVDVGNVTEYEFCGVPEGTTYYIALTAYDTGNNESDFSEEVVSTVTEEVICKCEGDFDCDGDVDGRDTQLFKEHFGRSELFDPCSSERICYGDFNCDQDVDGQDARIFKEDFGRSLLKNPCPSCTSVEWCIYP